MKEVIYLLVFLLYPTLSVLNIQATPDSYTINAVTTYKWDLQFQTTGTRTELTLIFPTGVEFSSTTAVIITSNANFQPNTTRTSNQITFDLQSSMQTQTKFTFQVTEVINPFYVYEGGLSYSSDIEGIITQTPPSTILYTAGSINNCEISFAGVTGQTTSTAQLSFSAINPINSASSPSSLTFYIQYSIYTSTTQKITSNGDPICAFSTDGGLSFSQNVTSVQDETIPDFTCTFTSKYLQANANIVLKLMGIRNPFTSTDYISISLTTGDGTYDYDLADACTNAQVTLVQYPGTFSQSPNVNSEYDIPSVATTEFVATRVEISDTLLMEYTSQTSSGISFSSCSNQIQLLRSSDPSITFTGSSIGSSAQLTTAQRNRGTQQIFLYLSNCIMTMPPSATPLPFTFTFKRNSLSYMKISASLQATFVVLQSSAVSLSIQGNQIGGTYSYVFTITNSQGLGANSRILIDVPLQIDISTFVDCNVSISGFGGVGTVNCSIVDADNNIFQINITNNNVIPPNSSIEIIINSLTNPNDPRISESFDIELYYDYDEGGSLVEKGTSLIAQQYGSRITYPILQTLQFTVYQLSQIVIQYTNEVTLPINTNIIVYFTANFSQLSYSFLEINNVSQTLIPSQNGQVFTITYNQQIQANSLLRIGFSVRFPLYTGSFQILDLQVTDSSGNMYERTSSSLNISVKNPAEQSFDITPDSLVTGQSTAYEFYFYSNIAHTLPFFLEIDLPTDVEYTHIADSCIEGNCQSNVEYLSSGGVKTIKVTINSQVGNSYAVKITSIQNPDVVGETGMFYFRTKTKNGEQIIQGSTTTFIQLPNILYAELDNSGSYSYYRSNAQAIKINVNVTNKLAYLDYFNIIFQHQTYSLNPNNSDVECVEGTCSVDNSSTTSVTVIRIVPSSNQVTDYSMNFIIQGLISSSTTNYQQFFDIQMKSYSQSGSLKDKGIFSYSIDCGDTAELRAKTCQTCSSTECFTCYSEDGYFIFSGICTNNCGNTSQYETFPNSGNCQSCTNFCETCYSDVLCKTCITSDYYLYSNQSCIPACNTNEGYYISPLDGQNYCYQCWDSKCLSCDSGSSDACTICQSGLLIDGRCQDSCGLSNTYVLSDTCYNCDESCNECRAGTNSDCINCASGYYNVSNSCITPCPTGSVPQGETCGCSSDCNTCEGIESNCTSCADTSHLLYSGQCITDCPLSTYIYINTCEDCVSGCQTCIRSGCQECLTGYNIYDGACYSQCNTLGDRFAAASGFCIQCPEGCDLCNSNYECSLCLSGYALSGTVCVLECEIDNSCGTTPTDSIIPLPGCLSAIVWLVIVLILKFAAIQSLYLPYSFLYFSTVVEFVLTIIVLNLLSQDINNSIVATNERVLQVILQPYQTAVFAILITILVINYILNILYIIVFCKYIRKLLQDRQIDIISNYFVLFLGTISSFRFCLISFSKMFPKPNIWIENASQLTPVHYLCGISIINTILVLAATGTLIYNETALSYLFMLSIDLLVLTILNIFCSIWMIARNKPDEYFQTTKKYKFEEQYRTEQEFNQKEVNDNSNYHQETNEKNISKAKLVDNGDKNSVVCVIQNLQEDNIQNPYDKQLNNKSDNENEPLPIIPIKATHINLQSAFSKEIERSDSSQAAKTRVKYTKKQNKNNNYDDMKSPNKEDKNKGEKGIQGRKKEKTHNFSKSQRYLKDDKVKRERMKEREGGQGQKEKEKQQNIEQEEEDREIQKVDISSQRQRQIEFQNEPTLKQTNSAVLQKKMMKPIKLTGQRSSIMNKNMTKKKQRYFESEAGESNFEEVDFEAIIQSKMIDKTNIKIKGTKTQRDKDEEEYANEEISPSWFNRENQRFDAEQSDEV